MKRELETANQKIKILANRLKNKDSEWRLHIDELQKNLERSQQLYKRASDENATLKGDFAVLYEKFAHNMD